MTRVLGLCALCALLIPIMAWAQASVNENQESAVIYVDTAKGSDSNPGTKSQPLKTISAAASIAISNNAANVGTRVIINPGIYRESINVGPSRNQTSAPITFQAATNGTVYVSGAVQYTNWAADTQIANAYTTAWPYQWGFCPPDNGLPLEQPIVERREMVFVNGASMTEVLSSSQMIAPGTFYVDETAGLLHLWPPPGTNMATADIEVATLPEVLTIGAHGIQPLNGLVFRGLVFEYAASCRMGDAAVTVSGQVSNLLFDSDQFVWNSAAGMILNAPGSNITVMNSTANHNGASGFNTDEIKNLLWQNVQASYNNWRGAQGAYYSWNTGGLHIFSDHGETISGTTLLYNQTHAIHWDTDVANVTADSIFASQNSVGVLDEKSEGPITITNSTFCNSFSIASGYAGFVMRDSENTSVSGSTFYNNSMSQVLLTGVPGGIQISNWETGQTYNLITQNFTFENNTVVGTGTELLFRDASLGGSDWNGFASTLSSGSNTWWNASTTAAFMVPTPNPGTRITFSQWQSLTGQDTNSVWAAPAIDPISKCTVMADIPDLWLVVDYGAVTADPSGVAVFNLETSGLGGFNGSVTLTLDGVASIPGASATLSNSSLTTNDTAVLTIQTSMTTPPGTYSFTVIANSDAITRTVTLAVVVPNNSVWLSTDSLTFLNEPVGFTSDPQTVTLTNLGSAPLPIGSITPPGGFSQTNTCGTQLAAGSNCTISVTFHPGAIQTYSGNLNINDGNPTVTQLVSLTGTVVGSGKVKFSSTSLSFGKEVYLKPSAGRSVTMTNIGTGLMNIASIAVTGANPKDFSQTSTCGPTLDVNASCAITVVFTPTALGARTASISVTDDGVKSPQSFTLSGSGATAISISAKSLTFVNTAIGSTSSGKTVTVTNLSTATLEMTGISISGADHNDFVQTSTCGDWITGGRSCTITVEFTPQAAFARSATLQINDSDPSAPQLVALSGTGYAITVSVKNLGFPSTKVGSSSAAKTATVTNLGSAAVSVSSIAITGANPSDFQQTNTCGASIGGGTSCTITVEFTPQAAFTRSASLHINDSDPSAPQLVALSGTGSAITVSVRNLSFPSTKVGSTSTGKTVTVTNLGSTAVSVSSIAITGTNPSDYQQTNTCGASIAGGTSCIITVTFTPHATGTRTATLTITDADPTSPQTVNLTGSGT